MWLFSVTLRLQPISPELFLIEAPSFFKRFDVILQERDYLRTTRNNHPTFISLKRCSTTLAAMAAQPVIIT
jgi:hypothetical protein